MSYLSQLKTTKKLNVYKSALSFIYNKFRWDITSSAIQSRKYFSRIKNLHKNKKLIILCNGPSLRNVDFKILQDSNVFVMGLNKINLLFDETDFRPNMIISVNKLVIEQNKDFFNSTPIDVILDSSATTVISKNKNVNFIHSLPFQLKFAGDISGSVCQGYTVTYVALQVAYHMGFSKVALVGCDHNFITEGSANMTVIAGASDPNHFSTKYFSDGVKWQLPDLLGSEMHYKIAKEYYENSGREVINCTHGGKLEIFKRMDLNDFLNE